MSEKNSKSKFPYDVERVPMRFYADLLNKIDTYQVENFIPYRNGAILELVRLGLHHQDDPSSQQIEKEAYGIKKNSSHLHLNISYPLPLLEKIDVYQEKNSISTRSGAITELIKIGLQHPF